MGRDAARVRPGRGRRQDGGLRRSRADGGGGHRLAAAARATFDRFAAADRYLFSVPLWNSGIPYILKQFIDVVTQPGMVFGFDPEQGYSGLLTGRKAAIIHTSAVYGPVDRPGFGRDFAEPYVADWLRFVGIEDAGTIRFRPNLVVADAEAGRQAAHAAARDLGKTF